MRMSVFVCELFHGLLLDTIHLLFVDSAGLLQNMLDLKEKMDGIEKESVDRKSTRLNSSHEWNSYAVFCLKKKKVDGVNLGPLNLVMKILLFIFPLSIQTCFLNIFFVLF